MTEFKAPAESCTRSSELTGEWIYELPKVYGFRSKTLEDEISGLLKFYAYNDAIFLAELNHERENSEESLYLFADCLMRANRKEEVYGLLRSEKFTDPKLLYLYSKCCFDLNKIEECHSALLDLDNGMIHSVMLNDPHVAPHAHLLHAYLLCEESHCIEALKECERTLELNILMWSAICAYIKYGGTKIVNVMEPHKKRFSEARIRVSSSDSERASIVYDTDVVVPNVSSRKSYPPPRSPAKRGLRGNSGVPRYDPMQSTPIGSRSVRPSVPRKSTRISEATLRNARSSMRDDGPHVARPTHSSRNRMSLLLSCDTENVNLPSNRSRGSAAAASRGSGAASRTLSLRSSTKSSEAKINKSQAMKRRDVVKQPLSSRNSNLARSLSGSTNSMSSVNDYKGVESEEIMNSLKKEENAGSSESGKDVRHIKLYNDQFREIFDLYAQIALLEEAVGTYNWINSRQLMDRMDRNTLNNSSIVRLIIGRSCFEQAEYGECRSILEELHNSRPWRVEGTELLSTSLWHIQDTHALSALAHTLTSDSRERAQSWCVAGNCFSLQRQHTQAIECMERALQLDHRFAYAYTLLGHELIVQDELEKAAGAFRSALLLSPRDYRAWYGLGLVHLKKEQNSLAQTNIQKAISINPTNRAMLCTLSQVEQQRGRVDKALKLIDRALSLNQSDVACRFNKARLLFEAKRNEECLEELNKLKSNSPDEAFVFHLLARVHRRIGNTHLALLNYSWAAELDPRGEQNIGESSSVPQNREEYEDDEYGSPV